MLHDRSLRKGRDRSLTIERDRVRTHARLPATPGSTSHLGTAGSVGRNFFSLAFPDFRIIKTLMSNESIVSVASDPEGRCKK